VKYKLRWEVTTEHFMILDTERFDWRDEIIAAGFDPDDADSVYSYFDGDDWGESRLMQLDSPGTWIDTRDAQLDSVEPYDDQPQAEAGEQS
jgi:hypothetical protein